MPLLKEEVSFMEMLLYWVVSESERERAPDERRYHHTIAWMLIAF